MALHFKRWTAVVNAPPRRPAFTLVELMITITVFAILAGLVLFAGQAVLQSSKRYRTKATISKINAQLMDKWDGFASRRTPSVAPGGNADQRASQRLWAMREFQRMEMPQNFFDILKEPKILGGTSNAAIAARPALNRIYLQYVRSKGGIINENPTQAQIDLFKQTKDGGTFGDYANAECLWMIVTFAMSDEDGGTKQFRADEVGDKDEDGFLEFHDAWGNPITFLRWAPGFANGWEAVAGLATGGACSDLIDVRPPDPTNPSPSPMSVPARDTFDISQLERRGALTPAPMPVQPLSKPIRSTYALTPVVLSGGPDGEIGIMGITESGDRAAATDTFPYLIDLVSPTSYVSNDTGANGSLNIDDPYFQWDGTITLSVLATLFGAPDGTFKHLDNIHSHNLEPN